MHARTFAIARSNIEKNKKKGEGLETSVIRRRDGGERRGSKREGSISEGRSIILLRASRFLAVFERNSRNGGNAMRNGEEGTVRTPIVCRGLRQSAQGGS